MSPQSDQLNVESEAEQPPAYQLRESPPATDSRDKPSFTSHPLDGTTTTTPTSPPLRSAHSRYSSLRPKGLESSLKYRQQKSAKSDAKKLTREQQAIIEKYLQAGKTANEDALRRVGRKHTGHSEVHDARVAWLRARYRRQAFFARRMYRRLRAEKKVGFEEMMARVQEASRS